MKPRHIFLIVLLLFTVIIFHIFSIFHKEISSLSRGFFSYFFIFYSLVVVGAISYGTEEDKRDNNILGQIIFFVSSVFIVFLTVLLFKTRDVKYDPEALCILYFLPFFLLFYHLIYFLVNRFFHYKFELAGKMDFFRKPVDWFLTLITIILAGICTFVIFDKMFGF